MTKLDAPSGTAVTLRETVKAASGASEVTIESKREGDAFGAHVLMAKSDSDRLLLTHESMSRRGFAEGAVRAAEWLSTRRGCYDFKDIYAQMS